MSHHDGVHNFMFGVQSGNPTRRKGIAVRRVAFLAGCAVLALGLLLAACRPGHNVWFKNQTDEVVTVWEAASQVTDLEPGEEQGYSIGYYPGTTTYRITDADGNVLFERTFTFDELGDYGDIVVTNDGSAPPSR